MTNYKFLKRAQNNDLSIVGQAKLVHAIFWNNL
jgi:hypothetical protein